MTGWHARHEGQLSWLERPGDGPTLVLLHGIGSNAGSFTPLLPHLPPDVRVIAWNAPGYLDSAPLAADWPVAGDYAQALSWLIGLLGIGRFTLLGHSLGALMAAAYAVQAPARVERLILASPALGYGVEPGGDPGPGIRARVDDLERLGAAAFAASRAARLVHAPDANPDIVHAVRDGMARVTMPGYGQAARMLASGRLLDDAARLTVPTDIVTGADDLVTPPDGARRLHAALPPAARGRLTILPDAGHAFCQQDPARLAAILAAPDAPTPDANTKETT